MMRNRLLTTLLLSSALLTLAEPSTSAAQQPKMDIKVFAGASSTTYVSMLETGRERETFAGWQIGFGPRVYRRKWFAETLLSFNRWAFSQAIDLSDIEGLGVVQIRGRVNSFELPFHAGYVPYKNSYFKLFLYGGYVNHFNTKILATVEVPGEPDEGLKLRPKEADLAIYQAIARFGVAVDLAMFNLDFNYSMTLNSATSTSYRTGYHQLQLNLAYLF
jgi:hypothetical protein